MTFHRDERAVPHSTEIAQDLQDRSEWHSQQQPKRRKQQQQVIDLASQSSVELCSPPGFRTAELGVNQRSLQALDPQQGQHAGADAHGPQAAAAAGQKRLWGDMAADDVTLVGSLPAPSMLWGSTRQRARRMRPSGDAAAAAVSTPILVMDEDSPANLSNDMKQQLHLQGPQGDGRHANRRPIVSLRTNPTRSPPMRPVSISPNPAIASMGAGVAAAGLGHAPPSAAVAARRRAVLRRAAAAPMPAPPAAAADAGQRRNSNSSSSSAEAVDVDADAALARRLAQEEEDRALAHRLMQEEEQAEQARLRANRHELEALQAAVGMQAAAAGAPTARRGENRRAFKAPAMPIMPPGYDPADTVLFQQQLQRRALSGAAAAAAAAPIPPPPQQQQQHGQMRSYDFGQMMAQMLLSMPMGRAGRTTGGQAASSAARRGLPPSLVHMREAVIGMQRAGLPPHMLFSDRDFTADDYELLCRLDETVENRKGAASTTIEALPTQTVPTGGLAGAAGERLSCAVCLEEFAEGSELRSLPCLHRFHKGCIDTWLRQKASCPVCNRDCT